LQATETQTETEGLSFLVLAEETAVRGFLSFSEVRGETAVTEGAPLRPSGKETETSSETPLCRQLVRGTETEKEKEVLRC